MNSQWLADPRNLRLAVDSQRASDKHGTLARLGQTLLEVQSIERSLRFTLTFVLQKGDELTVESLEAQTIAERTKTIGYFLSQIRHRATIHPDVDARLSRFLEMRNLLVHHLDKVPGWNLESEDGIIAANDFLTDMSAGGYWILLWLAGIVRSWQVQTSLGPQIDDDGAFELLETFRKVAETTVWARE